MIKRACRGASGVFRLSARPLEPLEYVSSLIRNSARSNYRANAVDFRQLRFSGACHWQPLRLVLCPICPTPRLHRTFSMSLGKKRVPVYYFESLFWLANE